MFEKKSHRGYRTLIDGIDMKTLVYGDKTLMAKFALAKDSVLPRHAHRYEQTGYCLSGQLRLFIGEDTFDANPGDSWCIPGDIDHGAEIMEDAIIIEVFSPVREDYLPEDRSRK